MFYLFPFLMAGQFVNILRCNETLRLESFSPFDCIAKDRWGVTYYFKIEKIWCVNGDCVPKLNDE